MIDSCEFPMDITHIIHNYIKKNTRPHFQFFKLQILFHSSKN